MALFLVTGGAGFIGSALVRELLRRGERVRVLDNFLTGRRENLVEVMDLIELFELDIMDLEGLRPVLKDVNYVLHQAALPSVPRSVEDPLTSHRINVDGTFNLLMAAREAGVKRLIYAASSSAYGDSPILPKVESMAPKPISPYGATKLVGEIYAQVFTHVYGLETVSLRYFNVFGPRQDPNSPYSGVLSLFMSALLQGRRPTIFGDGCQSRDFTYVDNVVDANLRACVAPEAAGKVVNIATGERQTLIDAFKILRRIVGTKEVSNLEPYYAPARTGDILHSQADINLARRLLAYKPEVSFEEGLEKTLEWYRLHEEVMQ